MVNKDKINKIFKNKKLYHKKLAKIPFEKKIKILVKLQKLADEIKLIKNKTSK